SDGRSVGFGARASVGAVERLGAGGVSANGTRDRLIDDALGQIGERRHVGERNPIFEPLLPDRRVAIDLTGLIALANLALRDRAHGLAVDGEVPARVGRFRHGARYGSGGSRFVAHDDDVAALLAADLERLAANLLVRDRVLRATLVAFDLHARSSPAEPS